MCNVQCAMCNVQCAMCNVQCAMCNVQCAMCNVQCAMVWLGFVVVLFITRYHYKIRFQKAGLARETYCSINCFF